MTARWRKARARYTIRMRPSYECLTYFACKVPNVILVFRVGGFGILRAPQK